MTLLFICGLLAGIGLSRRFTVLVLLPATAATVFAVIAAGLARADDISSIALSAAGTTAFLQVGYLAGILWFAGAARRLYPGRVGP
jgi:hypothetical protein